MCISITAESIQTKFCTSIPLVNIVITGCAVAPAVLTATGLVNGKGQFSTPHRIDTPQPITKKFVTGDYLSDPYGCAKLGAYPSKGGFWAHG